MKEDERMLRYFIHYENSLGLKYCILRYNRARHMLSIIWKGTAVDESIQEVEAGIKKMLTKFDCRSILNDAQEFYNPPIKVLADPRESDWDLKVAANSGVQFIAHVLPLQIPLPPPQVETQDVQEVRFFHHKMDAIEWLNQKNQV